ncbi:MAG: hypothetical protein WC983_11375 [Tissierellaceae bacterium]
MDRKAFKKKMALSMLIIIPFILVKLIHINLLPRPLPEEKRNLL